MKLNFVNELCELKGQFKGVDFRFIIHEEIHAEQRWCDVDALFRIPNGRLYRQPMKISEQLLKEDDILDYLYEFAYDSYKRVASSS